MADISTADLRQMLTEILTGNNSGPQAAGKGGKPSGGGANSSIIDSLVTNAGLLSTKFYEIVKAGAQLEIAWNTAGQRIGNEAAGAMEMLRKYGGGPLANMGDAAIKQSQQSMANSNAGIGGGSFMEMTTGLRAAGLTLDDYKNAVNSSKGALNNFAGNANSRAEQLNGVGSKLQDAAQAAGLTSQIEKDELGKIMLISQMGRTKELASNESKDQAAQSAIRLADTINRASISSGKNRDVIEKELAERLSSAEVQAQLTGATEQQRQSIIASQAAIAGMGKGAGEAAQVIQAGGRLSQENQIQLMSMGPKAMGEFMKGNQLLANAKTDDERRRAQELIDRSKVDTAEYQKTKGFQRLLQSAPDQLRGGLRKSYEENLERGGINATQANRAPGQTPQQAEAERQKGVENLSKSKLESGAKNPQAAPQQAMTKLNDAAFNSAVESLTLLNKELVKLTNSKSGIDAWGKAIESVYGKGGDVEKSMNVILNAGKQILGVNTTGGTTGSTTAPYSTTKPNLPPTSKKPITQKAAGGPVNAEEVYMVGENGPELFKSKTAGDIIPTDKTNSMFGDIKTKISSLSGSPNSEMPKAPPKFEMPKFEMPKFEMPKFEMPKFGGMAKENELAKKKKIEEEDTKQRPLDPSIKELKDRMSQVNASNASKAEIPKLDISAASPSKKTNTEVGEDSSPAAAKAANNKSAEPAPSATGTVTMKEVNDSLIRLNTSMDKLLKATLDISSHSEKTAKNSGKATGNRTHA
jgi:hypothetical protein